MRGQLSLTCDMNQSSGNIAKFPKQRFLRSALIASAALLSTIHCSASFAQAATADESTSAQPSTKPSGATSDQVTDIIVTATRQSTSLQKIPVTIQVVQADTLQALGVNGVLQVADLIPGLRITPSGGNNLYIRGVGSTSGGYSEGQTAVYLDGIYMPNAAMNIYSFNNVERIEVLKGPQGTLYGRNATAGLVSIITRDPGQDFRLDASVGYGNYDTWTQSLYVSAPINSTLAANFTVYNTKQSKGWSKNVFTGRDDQKNKETGIQAKLLWQPTDATKVTANFLYDENSRTYGSSAEVLPGTIATDGTTYLGKYRFSRRGDSAKPFHAYISSLKIQQDLGFANFMSLTAYQKSRQHHITYGNTGALGQPFPGQGVVNSDLQQGSSTWSQEFQLSSQENGSRLNWVAGLYYFDDVIHFYHAIVSTTCVGNVCTPPSRAFAAPYDLSSDATAKSYSGYADATYDIFDSTHLTVGLRYTKEHKEVSGIAVPAPGFPNSQATLPPSVAPTFTGITSLRFNKLTYRAVLAQDLGPNIHTYLSLNRGFKSGGFNATAFTNPPIKPEILDAYEAGVKTSLFDHKLRLNMSYFYYDYKDVQVRSTAGVAIPIVQNAASERAKGVDVDLSFVPTAGLTINGSFEYIDAKFRDYPGASCLALGPNTTVNGVLVGTITSTTCNLAGHKVPYAVPFSATVGFNYDYETSIGLFSLNASYHHDSRHQTSPDDNIKAPANDIVDASLGWRSNDKRFDILLYGKNLTKNYSYAVALETLNAFSFIPGAPRTYGIKFGVHY